MTVTRQVPVEPDTGEAGTSGDGVAGSAAAASVSAVTTSVIHWEGPLPPPALLEQYDRIVPGLARQITEEAKAEASHLRERDEVALNAAIRDRSRRQWMGFWVAAGFLLIALLALLSGDKVTPGIALSSIAAAAAAFIWERRRRERKKREEEE